MPKQTDIKPWLNTHLFRQVHLHPIFSELNRFGADLDYVLFLSTIFVFFDKVRQHLGLDRRRGLLPFSYPTTKLNGEKKPSEIGRLIDGYVDDPDRQGKGNLWFGKMIQFLDAESDALYKACTMTPLFAVFVQFGYPRELFYGKGDPGDPWGNFFLLAVTEHLGAIRGRGWKSKHDFAYRLLTMLRKDSVSIGNTKASAAGRVAAVKKNARWQAALSLLKSEFSKFSRPVGPASVK